MKIILAILIILLFAAYAAAEDTCAHLSKLRSEWTALEEKTSGGLFFTGGPTEANRLHTLRRIMERPGVIALNCHPETSPFRKGGQRGILRRN